jgi:hypothetical protein
MDKEQILQQLEDLGFPSLVDSIVEDNPSYGDLDYYITDVEKARRETTEEEFPQEEYQEVLSLIELYFRAHVLRENKMKITKRQLKRMIREEKAKLIKEGWTPGYSPDEDFTEYAIDMANEAAYQANTIDGPKGRAAKKLFLDMMRDEVAEQKAEGVDARMMTAEMNRIWMEIYR